MCLFCEHRSRDRTGMSNHLEAKHSNTVIACQGTIFPLLFFNDSNVDLVYLIASYTGTRGVYSYLSLISFPPP